MAYLKEHEEEIIKFVKSKNSKIESVQIDWKQTQWDKVGNGTPQGGGDIIDVYGTFNNIDNSGWHVMLHIENGKVNLNSMSLVNYLSVGGDRFE
ncbi:Phosphonate ABC transporter phosphate-binding periplasmic component [Streptococcus oralis]|uniref:Phosphonate ABC transporter phosphate-binding periplasmic component n=1 Tax=Streptococcus oralis TaxID=1303 RepID=A0A139P8W6_STROR|nr:Phosphonate ABC transporter phosphate-binding periplasmic component [Streptococcus oralis]